jgi:hypothetical protein
VNKTWQIREKELCDEISQAILGALLDPSYAGKYEVDYKVVQYNTGLQQAAKIARNYK